MFQIKLISIESNLIWSNQKFIKNMVKNEVTQAISIFYESYLPRYVSPSKAMGLLAKH